MALSWSARRQISIVGGFLAICIIIAGLYAYPKLNPEPTCFDNKQNGVEQGIDCGGTCQKICQFATEDVVVKWSRVFSVTDTVASVVAYIENPNIHAASREVSYEFKIYDENRSFIIARQGKTYIAPNGASAIFEGGIKVGNRTPTYVTFNFTQNPDWVIIDPRVDSIKIVPKDPTVENLDTKPRMSAQITNTSQLYGVTNISVVAIVYDKDDNAVGASQTFVEALSPGGSASTYFTWQKPFVSEPVRKEVISRFDVFAVGFQ